MLRRTSLAFCICGLGASVANAQPAPADRQNAIGAVQGSITGSFQGDPAQPNVTPAPKLPGKPPGRPPGPGGRPPVVIVTPGGYQARPLRSLAGDDFRNAVERALGSPIGQTIAWINASASGQVTAMGDRFVDGMNCRDVKQSVSTVASSQETTATYCLNPGGEWLLLVGPS